MSAVVKVRFSSYGSGTQSADSVGVAHRLSSCARPGDVSDQGSNHVSYLGRRILVTPEPPGRLLFCSVNGTHIQNRLQEVSENLDAEAYFKKTVLK